MKVLAFPRDANPYQVRLYDALARRGVSVRYVGELTRSQTVNLLLMPFELLVRRLAGARVLHVHWLFTFGLSWAPRFPAARRVARLWLVITLFFCRLCRLRVVWTAHNVLPHQPVFDDDRAARRALMGACAALVAHSEFAIDELSKLAPMPDKVAVVPHPADVTALAEPIYTGDVPGGELRLLFFGNIERYKNVPAIVEAMTGLAGRATLTIVGRCVDPQLAREVETLAAHSPARVELQLRRVPDDSLRDAIRQADAVVLPFSAVTTSGSVTTAMQYGKPVVIPDLPAFRDLPDDAVIKFDAHDGSRGLSKALAQVARMDRARLRLVGCNARRAAGQFTYDDLAAIMLEAFGASPIPPLTPRRPGPASGG